MANITPEIREEWNRLRDAILAPEHLTCGFYASYIRDMKACGLILTPEQEAILKESNRIHDIT